MASTSTTDHAVNVANFKTLTTTCTYFGLGYNPVNVALKLPALNRLVAIKTALIYSRLRKIKSFQKDNFQ